MAVILWMLSMPPDFGKSNYINTSTGIQYTHKDKECESIFLKCRRREKIVYNAWECV